MGPRRDHLPADRLCLVLHRLRLVENAQLRRYPHVRCRATCDSLRTPESVRSLRQDQVDGGADGHSRTASGMVDLHRSAYLHVLSVEALA